MENIESGRVWWVELLNGIAFRVVVLLIGFLLLAWLGCSRTTGG